MVRATFDRLAGCFTIASLMELAVSLSDREAPGLDPIILFGLRTPLLLDMLSCVEPLPTGNLSGCRFFVLQAVVGLLAC